MSDDWIIEVLSDLRAFARENGMGDLVRQLDTTLTVARSEVARRTRDAAAPPGDDGETQSG